MGKGSAERPMDKEKFRAHWDRIFGDAQSVDFVEGVDSNDAEAPSFQSNPDRQPEGEPHGLHP